jgi:general secretion pathway protein E
MPDSTLIPASSSSFVTRANPRDTKVARQILDFMVQSGLLDRLAADRAFQAQRQTGERIDVVVVQLGLISEASLLETMSRYFSFPVADVALFPEYPVLPELLCADFLKQARIVPIAANDHEVKVVTADPFATDSLAAIAYITDRRVVAMLGQTKDVEATLERLYGDPASATTVPAEGDENAVAQEDDVQRLRDIASEAPVIRLVNRLIANAIEGRASDIHIEPFADSLRVRYRIDGMMTEIERLPPEIQAGIASRIKILGRLNIAERRVPQDGRTKFVLGGREIDLRISTAPLMHGESIVLRILDRDAVDLDFATLGFDSHAQRRLQSLLEAPNGIVLVTGPTGSGKTTTLYTALKQLNSVERKVFTVEDPVEYLLVGVNQMQIKPAIGLDFVHCLRSILRQDPDVVMIGEMRDVETARTGIQASLTGHLVLSTLHTNSAAASIARLLDMGVEDYLLASTISGIMAQRLVRRLCAECAAPDIDADKALAVLDDDLRKFANSLPNRRPMRPVGCPACRHTGFRGRTTVYEILLVDEAIRRKIVRGVTDRDIENVARSGGMEKLLHNGLRKAMSGETTLPEVLRVARM